MVGYKFWTILISMSRPWTPRDERFRCRAKTFLQGGDAWFKLGWITFGGTAAHIAIMHDELVEKKRWISNGTFLHALSHCMILPGPEAQQLAIYIGWKLHGKRGGSVVPLLERSYSNNQYGKHRSLDLRVREGLNHG
jgi:hypothetical protein